MFDLSMISKPGEPQMSIPQKILTVLFSLMAGAGAIVLIGAAVLKTVNLI